MKPKPKPRTVSSKPIKGSYLGRSRQSTQRGLERLAEATGFSASRLRRDGVMGVVGQCGTCWRLADKRGRYLKVYVNPNRFPGVAFTHGLCPACLKINMRDIKEYLARKAGLKKSL